jgi:hypothetical protein
MALKLRNVPTIITISLTFLLYTTPIFLILIKQVNATFQLFKTGPILYHVCQLKTPLLNPYGQKKA